MDPLPTAGGQSGSTAPPLMHQTWLRLLFLHWRIPASALRPLVPQRLHLDTFDDSAWIALTPFTMRGIRLRGLPPIPLLDRAHEVNVRTYVSYQGEPGVWFFSLDIAQAVMALAARVFYHLPYYAATIDFAGGEVGAQHFRAHRRGEGTRGGELDVRWELGEPLPSARPGTREHFLLERYCLYAARGERLYRARIAHEPWPLRSATVRSLSTTLFTADGLTPPEGEPLVHAQATPLDVKIHAPARI